MQRVDHPDPAAANGEALHDLENGATGLSLIFAGAIGAYGYGLPVSEATIARALEGIHLDAGIALDVDPGPHMQEAARLLAAVVKPRGVPPAAIQIRFGFDPIGAAAAVGNASPLPRGGLVPMFSAAISELAAQGFRGPFAAVDGRAIHNAGGSEAQELAYALAAAVEYLRALEAGGIALDAAPRMVCFRLGRRCRPVLDHRQVPGAADAVGACRGGLQARACPAPRRGRDRVADDDQARSLREHVARDHRGRRRRPRRRRRHNGA